MRADHTPIGTGGKAACASDCSSPACPTGRQPERSSGRADRRRTRACAPARRSRRATNPSTSATPSRSLASCRAMASGERDHLGSCGVLAAHAAEEPVVIEIEPRAVEAATHCHVRHSLLGVRHEVHEKGHVGAEGIRATSTADERAVGFNREAIGEIETPGAGPSVACGCRVRFPSGATSRPPSHVDHAGR